MRKKRNCLCLIISMTFFLKNYVVEAQILNRQMFSSQGKNLVLKNGMVVSQSIGQQSVFGSFSNSTFIVQQGFQQNAVFKLSRAVLSGGVTTTVYPNPFLDVVKFEFSSEIRGPVEVQLFGVSGRVLFRDEKFAMQNIITLESLGYLARGEYLVVLSALNYRYVCKIIKN